MLGASLDVEGLRVGIRRYKYVSPPLSLCERLFLNDFWDRVAQCFPLWLAPNLITLIGGAFIATATGLLAVYSPELKGTAPPWVYLTNAALLFAYQTCDGADGKQARRTGAGSALGHLFDHGLDSMVGTLIATWSVDVFGQGTGHPLFPLLVGLGQLAFFLSNLVCVHKGSQVFYLVDVQEVELSIMLVLVLKGLGGDALWNMEVGALGYTFPLWLIIGGASVIGAVNNSGKYATNVLRPYYSGTAVPTAGGLGHALRHIASIAVYAALAMWNLWHLRSILHPVYLSVVFCFSGMVASLLMMVVAGLPLPLLHWAIVIQAGVAAAQGHAAAHWGAAVAAFGCYAHFVGQVIRTLKQELGILVFRIKPRQPPAER